MGLLFWNLYICGFVSLRFFKAALSLNDAIFNNNWLFPKIPWCLLWFLSVDGQNKAKGHSHCILGEWHTLHCWLWCRFFPCRKIHFHWFALMNTDSDCVLLTCIYISYNWTAFRISLWIFSREFPPIFLTMYLRPYQDFVHDAYIIHMCVAHPRMQDSYLHNIDMSVKKLLQCI